MKTRSKVWAILAAGAMTLSIAGIALATDLLAGQVGTKLSGYFDAGECADFPLTIGEGQIGVHFVLTSPDAASGKLDAVFSTDSFTGLDNATSPANTLHWYAVIDGDGNTTLTSAHTDVNGGNLVLSHACPGAEVSAPPSVPPSEEASVPASFSQSFQDITNAPSEPSTDSLGANGTSAPADGAWLLVVALGVLLASIVMLTPARAKSRR